MKVTNKDCSFATISVIPQSMDDNNLGPDCLGGSTALDTNHCGQPMSHI